MNSRKPKQDEYLIEWETPQLQLTEAVPSQKKPTQARPQWDAQSELIVDLGSNKPRSRLH